MSPRKTVAAGEATLAVTVVRTSSDPKTGQEKQQVDRMESRNELMMKLLTVPSEEAARISMSVSTKVSDAAYYGQGTWDKIPYSIEVYSSVSLPCNPDEQSIQVAQNIAHELAWEASRESIGKALLAHDEDIRTRLYAVYFEKE